MAHSGAHDEGRGGGGMSAGAWIMLLFGAAAPWVGPAYFLWVALRGRRGSSHGLDGEHGNRRREGAA